MPSLAIARVGRRQLQRRHRRTRSPSPCWPCCSPDPTAPASGAAPRDSEGNSTPVGLPNPKSRSASNCSAGVSRWENFAMRDVARHLDRLGQRQTSLRSCVRRGSSRVPPREYRHHPVPVLAAHRVGAVAPCRRPSSAAAVKSFAVEPGSNGSVKKVGLAGHHRAVACLARGHRQQLAGARIEHDDVAALAPRLRIARPAPARRSPAAPHRA